jgi:hypothetical protein
MLPGEIARPLIPEGRVPPQGGGKQNTPAETLFATIIHVPVSDSVAGSAAVLWDIEVGRALQVQ